MMGSAVRAGEPERRFYGEGATVRLRFLVIRTASSLARQESRAMLLLGVLGFDWASDCEYLTRSWSVAS